MSEREEQVETAARMLHAWRHRLGSGQVCDRCRGMARAIVEMLETPVA